MQIAFLFDAYHPGYKGNYGWALLKNILSTGILQASGRHMKVRIGDVTTLFTPSREELTKLGDSLFFSQGCEFLNSRRVREVFLTSVIFTWVLENVDEPTAQRLHRALSADEGYLGMHSVDLANQTHLGIYRLNLGLRYRIKGKTCHLFFVMNDEDSKDLGEFNSLRESGFFDVLEWEDLGAHGTVFDDYDTPDHFERVEIFSLLAAKNLLGGRDEADDLVLMLEDLSPPLLATLGSAARALILATHKEDVAQAGISIRRYIEQLADALFPASEVSFHGREVTTNKFKNRIWAYIDSSIPNDAPNRSARVETLEKELRRLVEEVNARAVHSDTPEKQRLNKALSDLARFSVALLQLNPETARQPYFAFQNKIIQFALGEI
jgi:hypothetical protein